MTDDNYLKARDEALKEYMDVNDFESGLRLRGIYTDEIIIEWIKSTFKYAHGVARAEILNSPEFKLLMACADLKTIGDVERQRVISNFNKRWGGE